MTRSAPSGWSELKDTRFTNRTPVASNDDSTRQRTRPFWPANVPSLATTPAATSVGAIVTFVDCRAVPPPSAPTSTNRPYSKMKLLLT